jgi:hypothetical protein
MAATMPAPARPTTSRCAGLRSMIAGTSPVCPAGRTVELSTITGAGHQSPGAVPNRLAQLLLHTDPPSRYQGRDQPRAYVVIRARPCG